MREIVRHPRRSLGLWGNDFDNLFEGFLRQPRWVEEASSKELVPAIDITEREHDYLVHAELPGVRKEDVDINVENGVLTITAQTKSESEEKDGDKILRQERRYGKYVRSLRLGNQVNSDKVKAELKNGVLEVLLPKAEEVKPRKISVNVG